MKEEIQEPEYKFSSINIERVNHGFIVEMDKRNCIDRCTYLTYAFSTFEDLIDFIKELK